MRKLLHAIVLVKRFWLGQLRVPQMDLIRRFLDPDSLCFDVGANCGCWTKPLAGIVKHGHVYSFEALPYYASVLRILNRLLFLSNVEVIGKAVSDCEGVLELAWKDDSGQHLTGKTHLLGRDEVSTHTVKVDTIDLDTFVSDRAITKLVFIKIDVEGAELSVLKGAEKTIKQHRPVIYCEIDERWTTRYGYTPATVIEFFDGKDYTAFVIQATLEVKEITKDNYAQRGDVLFVPNEKKHLLPNG